ncbi:MAG: PAS domain S-box protein [Balneolaceae bacterium]|nr:PAS domain S-box protein [Balneolaceae bacterium]
MRALNQITKLQPFKIALIYLVFAALWIAFTDQILHAFIADSDLLTEAQTYKGWVFVITTSLGLYYLIKAYQKQLRYSEEDLRTLTQDSESKNELLNKLFAKIPVFITIYDPDLEKIRVNREFEKATGWSSRDTEEVDLLEACFPNQEQRREAVEFAQNPGIGWKEFEMTTKSGEKLDTSWTTIRLSDETSVGIGIDMTETKATEIKLRESRELLRKTFDSLQEAVFVVDPKDRTIVDCNQAVEKVFGYEPDEVIGRNTKFLHLDENRFRNFHDITIDQLKENGVVNTEFKMRKKNGDIFISDHTVTYTYDREGEVDHVVSVVRDITEKKQTEEKIIQSVIEGEDRERRRVSRELHDGLAQYLTAASMNLEAVKQEAARLSEKRSEQLRNGVNLIRQSISEARTIAHNLMPRVIEEQGLVRAVESMIDHYSDISPVSFSFNHTIEEGLLSKQDQLNLYRIIQESVNNAIKFAECSKISIQIYRETDSLSVTIEDNGKGADFFDEEHEKGYGLKSIQSRTKAMGGTVKYDSIPQKGTSIHLEIPLNQNISGSTDEQSKAEYTDRG